MAGETYISAALTEASGQAGGKLNVLTPTEFEVFSLLAEGRSVIEVAAQLCTSAKTTSHHYTSIKRKLRADNMTQFVLCAVCSGVLNPH